MLALVLGACSERDSAAGAAQRREAAIGALAAACVESMVRNTCQVVGGSTPASSASIVFIAGVGAVDAQSYRALRESGDAMCATVRQSCGADWEAPACRTARALWPTTGASAPR